MQEKVKEFDSEKKMKEMMIKKLQDSVEKEKIETQSRTERYAEQTKVLNEVLGKLSDAEKQVKEFSERELELKELAQENITKIEADLAKSEQQADKLRSLEKQRDEEISDTCRQRDIAVEQVSELKTKLQQLQDSSEQEHGDMKKKFELWARNQKEENTKLQQNLSDESAAAREKDCQIKSLQADVQSVTNRLEELKVESEQKNKNEIGAVEQNLKAKISDLVDQQDKLTHKLIEQEAQVEELNAQLSSSNEQAAQSLNDTIQMKEEFKQQEVASQTKQQELKEQQIELTAKYQDIEEQLEKSQTKIKILIDKLESSVAEIQTLSERLDKKSDLMNQIENKYISLEEESLTKSKEYSDNLSDQKQIYESQIAELQTLITEKDTKFDELRTQNTNQELAQNKLDQSMSEISSLKKQLEDLESENYEAVISLKEEQKKMKAEIRDKEQMLKTEQDQKSEMQVQIADMEDQLNFSQAAEQIEKHTPREGVALQESALQEELDQTREELAGIVEHYKGLEDDLVSAKLNWAQLDLENDQLSCNINKYKYQIKVFSSKVTMLEIEIVKLRQASGQMLDALPQESDVNQTTEIKKKGRFSNMKNYFGFGGKKESSQKEADLNESSQPQEKKKSIWNAPL